MQAMLTQAAARHRAEEEGRPEVDVQTDFVELTSSGLAEGRRHLKACGEVEDLTGRDEPLERFNPEDDDWRELDAVD